MNIIQIPFEHKMFEQEFSGELTNFIYHEFSFIFTLEDKLVLGVTVFFESNNGDISGTQIHLIRLGQEWIKDVVYEIELDSNLKTGLKVRCNKSDKKYLENGFGIAEIVFRTMIYIMNAPREKIVKQKNPQINPESNAKNEKKNSKEYNIYLLDEIVDYVNANELATIPNGTHKIQCPCWSVRGHYRHYKNGNVVFIKNYEKGKNKGKIKPKDKIYTV